MANFDYNPGVQDRRGDYFAQGLNQAFTSLANGIQQAEAKHKESKAYAQLAEVLGMDPRHTTKQDVQVAIMKNQILQGMQDRQRQQKAQSSLGKIMSLYQANRRGGNDPAATLQLGRGPLANMVQRPPMQPGDAAAGALAAHPEVFGDTGASSTASNLLKMLGTMSNDGGITIDANTGLPVLRSGNSSRVINPAWLRPTASKASGPGTVTIPGVGTVYTNNGREINPKMAVPSGGMPATKGGKFPKDAKIVTMEGKQVALYSDGSWTPLPSGGGATQEEQEILAAAGGSATGHDGTPENSTEENASGAATEYSKGDRVEQNGVMYEYDGTEFQPVNE